MYWPLFLFPVKQGYANTQLRSFGLTLFSLSSKEAAWPSGQRVGLVIRRSQVRVRLWPLAGFVLGGPEFKSSATHVNSQLGTSCQLGLLILLCYVCVTDPGDGPGGPGSPPPLIFRPNWRPKGRKKVFEIPPPSHFISGSGWPGPALSEGLDLPLCLNYLFPSIWVECL